MVIQAVPVRVMELQLSVCCGLLAVVKVSVGYIYSSPSWALQGSVARSWPGFVLQGA